MKIIKNLFIAILILAVLGIIGFASEFVTYKFADGEYPFYIVEGTEEDFKFSWSREEVEEINKEYIQELERKTHTITTLEEQLLYFEGTEKERQMLKSYIEDIETGRVSIKLDHVLADKLTQWLNKNVPQIYYTQNGVKKPMEVELMRAIVKIESDMNPTVVSWAGAQGIAQVMPATARMLGLDNAFDMEQGIIHGTRHLARLLTKYNGNYYNAISAYNAGEGNVDRWLRDPKHSAQGVLTNIPFPETRKYTPNVLKHYNMYK
jgi:hypothetical protein